MLGRGTYGSSQVWLLGSPMRLFPKNHQWQNCNAFILLGQSCDPEEDCICVEEGRMSLNTREIYGYENGRYTGDTDGLD